MLNRCRGWFAALTGAIFLLSTGVYLDFATEFRPESVATPLFLLALLFTSSDSARWSRLRSLASGAALILAVWSSEKALFYGIIFFFAVFADLLRARRPFLLARPDYFVLGSTLILLTIGAYLTVTANWLPSWRWAFAWAFEHEKHYPGFSPLLYLGSVSRQDGWILGLGIAGWISEARKISICRLPVDRRFIIIWTYWAAFLSFVVQRAPYPYSLVPFVALNAVYGGRFIALVYQYLTTRFPHHAGIPTAALIVLAFSQWDYVPRRVNQPEKTNLPQLETLRTIGQLTRSDDSLYDNTGGFVARPSAHFFYFTDAAVRNTMKAFLNKEMPAAIRKNRALVYLHDIRFQSLPDELKAFITEHYQPYTSDIWIWGKRFDSTLSDWNFEALESGTYFIYPATIVERGKLLIGDMSLHTSRITLGSGVYRVRWEGPATQFYLMWLPRNGRTFRPIEDRQPRFSRLF
jgi:hypothetical protein